MKRMFGILILLALGPAWAQEYRLSIGGEALPQAAITVNGQIYVPLEALTRAGVVATIGGSTLGLTLPGTSFAGGANERQSLEGCVGTDLFNGIWRVKVLSVEPIKRDPGTLIEAEGWGLTVEVRNGTTQTLQPVFTGISGTGEGIQLVLSDETILNAERLDVQTLTFASLPQGGGLTHQLKFYHPYDAETEGTPDRLLFQITPEEVAPGLQQAGVVYSTPHPSLRVSLTCGGAGG